MASRREVEKDYIELKPQSVRYRMSILMKSGSHSDVTFLVGVGNGQRSFKAHRLVLAIASDVFEAMFFGSLADMNTIIKVPDLEPEGFAYMLRYVYEDKIDFDSADHAILALTVAQKYLLEHFKLCCCNYLIANITPDIACHLFEIAYLYDVHYLQAKALYELLINTEVVISCESFSSAQQSTVEMLLRQENLEISSESKLFLSILKWVNAKTINKEKDADSEDINPINPLLPYVRFLSMTAQEFTNGPAKSGALTNEEILSLLMNIVSPGSKAIPEWCCKKPKRGSPRNKRETCTVSCSNYLRNILPLCEARYVECKLTVTKKNAIILGVGFAAKWRDYTRYREYETNDVDLEEEYETEYITEYVYERDQETQPFQGHLAFMKVCRNNNWLHSTVTCTNDRSGECCAMFESPQLVYEGETCVIRIDFGTNTTVGRCTGAYAKEVKSTVGVEFLIESKELFVTDVSHIHKIYFWCFE